MALISSTSRCCLCNELVRQRPFGGVQHIMTNELDRYYSCSDSCFHLDCLAEHEELSDTLRAFTARRNEPRKCAACGELILRESFNLGCLSTNRRSPLYKFNFLQFHPEHLLGWDLLTTFLEVMAPEAGLYRGGVYARVVKQAK